jgi:hypothetical protein
VAKSGVIAVLLLLAGVDCCLQSWVYAQDSPVVDSIPVGEEAAGPAESGYLFFPRPAVDESATDEFSVEASSFDHSAAVMSGAESGAGLDDQAWNAAERFSKGNFHEAIPIQYPLDDSAYEAEAPTGDDPDAANGRWRDSSIHRPAPDVALEDQPWVEWHKITLQAQTLPTGEQGLGVTSLDVRGTLKFARVPFLFVTPRGGWHFLDGPPTTDLPPRLYDLSVDTTIYMPLNDRWTVQASLAPGFYTDGKATKDAFRMTGRALAFYVWSPELQLAGGFVYLGRKDVVALPAAGLVYTPTDDLKFDLMFPKPRAGYRYHHDLERERWVYCSGELGGGSWAVRRVSGDDDVASYRDFQLLVGIEHKEPGVINWQLEGGYAFSRRVEYISKTGDTDLPSTAVLRVVLSY